MEITVGKSVIDVDVDATRGSYASMLKPGPEECGCSYCRNWAQQRRKAYPQAVVALLTSAGIRFGYETEVWDVPWDDGRRYCSGWYPFVGTILRSSDEHEDVDGMELWVSNGLSYSVPWLASESAHEIHFAKVIDWVLDEPAEAEQSPGAYPSNAADGATGNAQE